MEQLLGICLRWLPERVQVFFGAPPCCAEDRIYFIRIEDGFIVYDSALDFKVRRWLWWSAQHP